MLWKAENFHFLCFGKQKMYCYLAIDDVEIGHLNRIPLWMFGMLY